MASARLVNINRLKKTLRSKSVGAQTLPEKPRKTRAATIVEDVANRDAPTTENVTQKDIRPDDSKNPLLTDGSESVGRLTPERTPSFDANKLLPHNVQSDNEGQIEAADSSPLGSPLDHGQSFDLAPPPPKETTKRIDWLAERVFSDDHLRIIIRDQTQIKRFTTFLTRYKPHAVPVLNRYLETQKAIKAVEYANAIAETLSQLPSDHSSFIPCSAAILDGRFEARSRRAFDSLLHDALPAWITHSLVQVVTEVMVKEITGNSLPLLRNLIGGLAEVFCLSDPSLPDNPIVYASEEFYRTTQYGRDYSLGKNCRFLQGPKTDRNTISRLKAATESGEEICETVLNYRRDGTPFINLLMAAPLCDNRGRVRYYIGCQLDVTGLVEEGRGVESFAHLLAEDRHQEQQQERQGNGGPITGSHTKDPMKTLGELGQMLSLDESNLIHNPSQRNSMCDDVSIAGSMVGRPNSRRENTSRNSTRRVLGEDEHQREDGDWALSSTGLSGKLPGVYQNYLLVRPSPSLRIIFLSPSLRVPGLLQSHFLSRIGGPARVRDGISDAFATGVPVTAKVTWLPMGRHTQDNYIDYTSSERGDGISGDGNVGTSNGKIRWLNCTPLFGSDDKVGVWMVVMVEDERVTGTLASRTNQGRKQIYPTPAAVHEWPTPPRTPLSPRSPLVSNGGPGSTRSRSAVGYRRSYNEIEVKRPRGPMSVDGDVGDRKVGRIREEETVGNGRMMTL